MAPTSLNIDVQWPQRAVKVSVEVKIALGALIAEGAAAGKALADSAQSGADLPEMIDSDVLFSAEDLRAFLVEQTRWKADDAEVRAQIFAPLVPKLLTLLGVDGPPPDPIPYPVAQGG